MKDKHWRKTGRDRTRAMVRERDGYRCQYPRCEREQQPDERAFDVHHRNGLCGKRSRGYDKVGEMGGLITYCHQHHMQIHGRGGEKGKLKYVTRADIDYYRAQGLSYDAIGKLFGASQSAIYNKHNHD